MILYHYTGSSPIPYEALLKSFIYKNISYLTDLEREPANVVGELPVRLLSLAFTRGTVKSLLFLSHRVLKRPCNPILPAIPKQGVSILPMTGLPTPFYLFGVIMWSYQKTKEYLKDEITLIALKDSGPLPNIGSTSIGV